MSRFIEAWERAREFLSDLLDVVENFWRRQNAALSPMARAKARMKALRRGESTTSPSAEADPLECPPTPPLPEESVPTTPQPSGPGLWGVDLKKRYGGREVVGGVSPELHQGEIVGLLGPNGAGKTTTFYLLLGIVRPTSGEVLLDGMPITSWPLHERARVGLSYLPQESSIFRTLTVRENLQIILEYTGLTPEEQSRRAEELLTELGITHLADQKAAVLSGGERRRLEIARALIRNPKFILLDEPFAGIDPLAVDDIQLIIKELKAKGIGVLISDHNVRETLLICDRAYLVFGGRIIFQGTPEEIVANPRARCVYLGEDFCL